MGIMIQKLNPHERFFLKVRAVDLGFFMSKKHAEKSIITVSNTTRKVQMIRAIYDFNSLCSNLIVMNKALYQKITRSILPEDGSKLAFWETIMGSPNMDQIWVWAEGACFYFVWASHSTKRER